MCVFYCQMDSLYNFYLDCIVSCVNLCVQFLFFDVLLIFFDLGAILKKHLLSSGRDTGYSVEHWLWMLHV